jgi:hypothetical protein
MCIPQVQIRKATAKDGNEYIYVKTPYSKDFVKEARKLNGSWVDAQKEWAFDPRDVDRVREVCRKIYGTDGLSIEGKLVTVRLHLDKIETGYDKLELFGRTICRRPNRDSYVKLDPSVIVVAGGFPDVGGSSKNPCLLTKEGTILDVRDVPESIVHPEKFPEGAIEILANDKKPNIKALKEEAAAIRSRLAEILEILAREGEKE